MNETELARRFGEIVRRRRFQLGLTQKRLADRAGVSYQQIQKYETGANHPSLSRLFDLAKALETEPAVLIAAIALPTGVATPETATALQGAIGTLMLPGTAQAALAFIQGLVEIEPPDRPLRHQTEL